MSLFFLLFSFFFPEEGDFPENLHRVVYVIINKRSFESVMCLYPILSPSLYGRVFIVIGIVTKKEK